MDLMIISVLPQSDRKAGGVLSLQMFTCLFIIYLTLLFVLHAGEYVVCRTEKWWWRIQNNKLLSS